MNKIAYIIVEWNEMDFEDCDFTNKFVYLNKEAAYSYVDQLNKEHPVEDWHQNKDKSRKIYHIYECELVD